MNVNTLMRMRKVIVTCLLRIIKNLHAQPSFSTMEHLHLHTDTGGNNLFTLAEGVQRPERLYIVCRQKGNKQ
jgi:hypothetical protein